MTIKNTDNDLGIPTVSEDLRKLNKKGKDQLRDKFDEHFRLR